jgi:TPR repeat protein
LYKNINDDNNALKYFNLVANHNLITGYINLMIFYYKNKNLKLANKYYFYVSMYAPQRIIDLLENNNNYNNDKIEYLSKLKEQIYYHNSDIFIADLIGKEKMEEFSCKFSNGEKINEVVKLPFNNKINFVYE